MTIEKIVTIPAAEAHQMVLEYLNNDHAFCEVVTLTDSLRYLRLTLLVVERHT